MTKHTRLAITALACGLAVGATSRAQIPSAASVAKEEAIELSPFEVKTAADRGYVASETMTGTRVATKIADLPYVVNVLTSEYFNDFAMFELGDNLTQISSFNSLDIGGGFTLRGFSATSQLRDGFYRLGRYGSSNIDRIEVIKGSNAAIYGRTSAGGMVNFISKMPKNRPETSLTLNYGSQQTQRGVIESTGPLLQSSLGKTSYILTLSQYQRGWDMDYSRIHNQEYYLGVKHVFKDNSSLFLQAEFFLQKRHAPTSGAPLIVDQKGTTDPADDVAVGYAMNLVRSNAFGPNSELNRGNISYTGTYEKKINDVWSIRTAGNYYRARRWDYNQNTGFGAITINTPTPTPITTTRGATPQKGLIMEDGGGIQADALAHYWLADKKIEARSLITVDFNDYYRWDPGWNYGPATNPDIAAWTAATSGRVVTLDSTYRPTAPLTYFPKWFQWGNETMDHFTRRRTTVLGGLVRQQLTMLNGDLLAFAGARFDAVRFQERDYVTAASSFTVFPGFANYQPGQMIHKSVTQFNPNMGVNYKVTKELRLFANYARSYFVNQTDNPISFADPGYKPETADGYDYGVKGGFFNDALNFTVSGFYYRRQNVSVSDTYENPIGSGLFVTQNRRDGDQLVRGFDIDANWRLTDEVSLQGGWGHIYSVYTDFGSASPLAVGRRVNGVTPDNASVSIRYAPRTGVLSGFSANARWTYTSSTPTEQPNAGDTYTTAADGSRVLARTTYQWRLRVPTFAIWDAGVRYTFRSGPKLRQTIAVNINNLADKDYLKINRNVGDHRGTFVTYTLAY